MVGLRGLQIPSMVIIQLNKTCQYAGQDAHLKQNLPIFTRKEATC